MKQFIGQFVSPSTTDDPIRLQSQLHVLGLRSLNCSQVSSIVSFNWHRLAMRSMGIQTVHAPDSSEDDWAFPHQCESKPIRAILG
jgi:hypothetical protein